MTEETNTQMEQEAKKQYTNPMDFLASLPGAPTPAMIEGYKQQAPAGRIKLFTPDGKRVFILRGISGFELSDIQKKIPQNASDVENEIKLAVCCKAVIWTNTTQTNLMDEMTLRAAPAGLPETIHQLVAQLSDFFDPIQLNSFAADL